MAKPGNLNLPYVEGDDETFAFQLKNGGGSPIDLTGATIACEAKVDYGEAAVATAVCTVTDGANGLFTVEFDQAATRAMAGAKMKYDIQVTIGGKTRTYINGELTGTKEVTV